MSEYQVSALPFATSSTAVTTSTTKVEFPFVTRFFTVRNTSAFTLGVGFTNSGALGGNRFTLPPSGSYANEHRVKDLYLIGVDGNSTFEVVAGLTMIDRTMMPTLTASGAPGIASASSDLSIWGYSPGLG